MKHVLFGLVVAALLTFSSTPAEACSFDSDCAYGKCRSGKCGACSFDSDCKGHGKCRDGWCSQKVTWHAARRALSGGCQDAQASPHSAWIIGRIIEDDGATVKWQSGFSRLKGSRAQEALISLGRPRHLGWSWKAEGKPCKHLGSWEVEHEVGWEPGRRECLWPRGQPDVIKHLRPRCEDR